MTLHQLPHLCCSTGIANSQSSLNCGPVCLLTELSCSCELADSSVLGWRLVDLNMEQIGDLADFTGLNSPGDTETFAEGHFIANLTAVTAMTGTSASVATGTVSQTIDGYTLQCLDASSSIVVVGEEEISIPGKQGSTGNDLFICLSNKCPLCSPYR